MRGVIGRVRLLEPDDRREIGNMQTGSKSRRIISCIGSLDQINTHKLNAHKINTHRLNNPPTPCQKFAQSSTTEVSVSASQPLFLVDELVSVCGACECVRSL